MKKLSRDSWLAIFLFVVLAVVLVINFARQQRNVLPPLASISTQPDGARALWLWLEELGYQPSNQSAQSFSIPDQSALMLMLEPTTTLLPQDWRTIDAWVKEGGTLLVAGEAYQVDAWLEHYEFQRHPWNASLYTATLRIQNPLFVSPPVTVQPLQVRVNEAITTTRQDIIVHAALDDAPVIVSFPQGQGRVILSTLSEIFSNEGLRTETAPELLLNLLSWAGKPGHVWFDEWHHGIRGQGASNIPVGISEWVLQSLPGRALLLAFAIVFAALALQGRNFGRPLSLPQTLQRHAAIEYVNAIANLNHRAGHRQAVLQDYYQRLKRTLGRRYRLDGKLPDEEFVTQLARYNPELDQVALRQLLQQLRQATNKDAKPSEDQVVQLAAKAVRMTK